MMRKFNIPYSSNVAIYNCLLVQILLQNYSASSNINGLYTLTDFLNIQVYVSICC